LKTERLLKLFSGIMAFLGIDWERASNCSDT
jgi:hypothetical protein